MVEGDSKGKGQQPKSTYTYKSTYTWNPDASNCNSLKYLNSLTSFLTGFS